MFRIKTQLAVVLLAATLAGCGSISGYGSMAPPPPPPPPPPSTHTIDATNSLVFSPASLQVSAGETVTFTFGSVAHNVFFATQAGAPADITGNNASVSIGRQFTMAGTYNFTCHIHPSMHGSVVVQ